MTTEPLAVLLLQDLPTQFAQLILILSMISTVIISVMRNVYHSVSHDDNHYWCIIVIAA